MVALVVTQHVIVVKAMLESIVKSQFAKKLVKMEGDVLDPIDVLVSMDTREDTVKLTTELDRVSDE